MLPFFAIRKLLTFSMPKTYSISFFSKKSPFDVRHKAWVYKTIYSLETGNTFRRTFSLLTLVNVLYSRRDTAADQSRPPKLSHVQNATIKLFSLYFSIGHTKNRKLSHQIHIPAITCEAFLLLFLLSQVILTKK